jgi:AcrR family transcriptional regulator
MIMSLRKEKAARLKFKVLDTTKKLIGRKSFEDLYVDDICDRVEISKVTLFKYFPQKEDILLYYFRAWCLARSVEFTLKPKEGLQGVYHLFDRLSEEFEEHPGLLLSLTGYLGDLKRPLKPFPLKAEEKRMFHPSIEGVTNIEILSLDQMLEKFILEAIFRKEITKTISTRDITNLINSVFLGGVVTAHVNQLTPPKNFFRKNLDLVVKGLG